MAWRKPEDEDRRSRPDGAQAPTFNGGSRHIGGSASATVEICMEPPNTPSVSRIWTSQLLRYLRQDGEKSRAAEIGAFMR